MITDSDRSAELPPVVETGTIYFIAPHSMLHPSPRAFRLTIGGLLGAGAWPLLAAGARWVPEPLQFLIGWFVFTIGPGFVVAGAVSRRLDRMTRVVVLLAAGSAAAPGVIDLLGRSHTVPPTASYYSGHQLNAAYYAHLVAAMIHRFLAVPVLAIFFRYAWPTYVSLTAAVAFVLVRLLAARAVAVLAVVLLLLGSDLSYLAAWFLPHAAVDWDYLLWPTNFLSPTMQVMHFSTWTPSLPVFFTALYGVVRGLQTRSWGWIVVAGFVLGILF